MIGHQHAEAAALATGLIEAVLWMQPGQLCLPDLKNIFPLSLSRRRHTGPKRLL